MTTKLMYWRTNEGITSNLCKNKGEIELVISYTTQLYIHLSRAISYLLCKLTISFFLILLLSERLKYASGMINGLVSL